MRLVFPFVLAFSLLFSVAFAEIDLSGYTYEELSAIRDQALLEMMERDEWQLVLVPVGTYRVGEHIPAGHWTIFPIDESTAIIKTGMVVEDDGKEIKYDCPKYYKITLTDSDYRYYRLGDATTTDLVLTDGMYVEIVLGGCYFAPYVGTEGLGFAF